MWIIGPILFVAIVLTTGIFRGSQPGSKAPSSWEGACVVFSQDGKLLLWSFWNQVGFWETGARQISRGVFAIAPLGITSIALSADGRTLATAFAPPGRRIFAIPPKKQDGVWVWNVATSEKVRGFLHGVGVDVVALSPDGKTLACGTAGLWGRANRLRIFEVETGKELEVPVICRRSVLSLAFSPDGRELAVANLQHLRILDSATRQQRRVCETQKAFLSVAYSPHGQLLGSGSSDGKLYVWKFDAPTPEVITGAHKGRIDAVAFSPSGQVVASAGDDKDIKLWDVAAGKQIGALAGHRRRVTGIAFSPDGKMLASAGAEGRVWLWDVATGQQLEQLAPAASP